MSRKNNHIVFLLIIFGVFSVYGQNSTSQKVADTDSIEWELFPILTYDTDAGFGVGLKGYIRNLFERDESYDVILYNSTRGERWYRFQFSYPDFEFRHGSIYGYAIDITAEYDKWINYYFYGIGNESIYNSRILYTRAPLDLSLIISRTLTPSFIIQSGIKYSSINYLNFPETKLPAMVGFHTRTENLFLLIFAVYDTRNSITNPNKGFNISTGYEWSPDIFNFSQFDKAFLTLQSYHKVIFNQLTFAERISLQQLIGKNIPVQFLLPIGGNQTLRGYPQDRFIDKSFILVNAEMRFPIWWRFGGIAGVDAGRVFPSLSGLSIGKWKISPAAGLRFYMNNFVVRADFGFSNETMGFYFNFGHLF